MTDSTLKSTFQKDIPDIAASFGYELTDVQTHRKVWRLQTTTGLKYLKKSKLQPLDIWFIFEALEHLHSNSFPNVPRLEVNCFGEPFVNFNNCLYIMSDWMDSQELDFQLIPDLKQAINFLAHFHIQSTGFEPSSPCPERTVWLNWPKKIEQRLREMMDFRRLAVLDKENSQFSRLYLRYFEIFYRQAVACYQTLLQSPYPTIAQAAAKQKSFCHHDFSGRNLLRTHTNQLILVDYDYCLSDIRIHDLLNLILRNLKHQNWDIEVFDFILTQYQKVSPLTREEIEVLKILLAWPQDFWQFGHQYYYESLPWPFERYLKKLENKINSRFVREQFLKQLNSGH